MTTIRPAPAAAPPGAARRLAEAGVLTAAGTLCRDGTTLRRAIARVGPGDDAWDGYVRAVDSAVSQLQAEMVLAGARLQGERAEDTTELHSSLDAIAAVVRQRLEDLRVRAHLGRMEADSAIGSAIAELERHQADLRAGAHRMDHDARTTVHDVGRLATTLADDVVAVLRVAAAAADDPLPPPPVDGPRP